MEAPKIFESEYRFCLILWENEPVSSGKLVELCKEGLGWSKATTYTVIRRLSERGELKNENTIVTFTGSVPVGVSLDDVKVLLSEFKKEGAKIVIDSRSFGKEDLLELQPWLIKPNRVEATKYLGKTVQTVEAAVEIATIFHEGGIENSVISLGGGGAVLVCKEGTYLVKAPKCGVVSIIGAGDSLLAGFLTGATQGWPAWESLRLAVACGSAACMTAGTRPPEKENIDRIFAESQVEKLA